MAQKRLVRIIHKNGSVNILNERATGLGWMNPRRINFLEMKWYTFVVLFCSCHLVSFMLFAAIYTLFTQEADRDATGKGGYACFDNVKNYLGAFLFSMESQQTIGYGLRVVNVYCPEAVVAFIFHALVGLTLSSIFTGLFFARFANQGNVGTTIKFSQKALITRRNGELFFIFRVADVEENGSDRGADAAAICIREYESIDGEQIPIQIHGFKVGFDLNGEGECIPLLYPSCVAHRIDQNSPLYTFGPDDLKSKRIEIVVWLTGTRSKTGTAISGTASYTSDEIIWGGRFVHNKVIVLGERANVINFSQLEIDRYELDSTPRMSAKDLHLQQTAHGRNIHHTTQ